MSNVAEMLRTGKSSLDFLGRGPLGTLQSHNYWKSGAGLLIDVDPGEKGR